MMLKKLIYQLVSLFYLLLNNYICSGNDNNIPAFYIFGDSSVDVGNNLYLKNTLAKPVFPNGIDFGNPFGEPSGRYTNGRITVDMIGQESGLQNFTPPYLAPTTVGDVILKGVNFASSAAGILNGTGSQFGNIIPMDVQINYFVKTRQNIIAQIGAQAAKELLNRAIYIVAIGSNDVFSASETKSEMPVSFYLDAIISIFRSQLTRLYKLGAMKFMVANVGVMGCSPALGDWLPSVNDGCTPSVNKLAKAYNRRLRRLLNELNMNLTGSKFVLSDYYAISEDVIQHYISYGFEFVDQACCSLLGSHGGFLPCFGASHVCEDRSKYVFWDAFHLTETANLIAAKHMMDGGLNYMSPMNFRQLLNID